tara:strand:- start:45 stop:335 length:291 start_codon:yes stop_codon:yes gene_type:complete
MKLIFENWRKALKEKKQENSFDLVLPRDKEIVLKADQEGHERGLVVKFREDGGYDVYYWYDNPDTPVPAELKADGKKIGDDIKKIFLGYHPEIDEK